MIPGDAIKYTISPCVLMLSKVLVVHVVMNVNISKKKNDIVKGVQVTDVTGK